MVIGYSSSPGYRYNTARVVLAVREEQMRLTRRIFEVAVWNRGSVHYGKTFEREDVRYPDAQERQNQLCLLIVSLLTGPRSASFPHAPLRTRVANKNGGFRVCLDVCRGGIA